MKKIVMIGPVYPYKGGISHYTGLMYRALSKKYDVEMISFKMQYPKILFKAQQKDYDNDSFAIPNTKYWLHTANPLNIISVAKRINNMNPDLIIIPWWHPYFSICFTILTTFIKRKNTLYVCHNVLPHKRFIMDRFLTKMTLKKGKTYITQSKQDAKDLCEIIKNPVFKTTPHPTYNIFKIQGLSKEESRKILGIGNDEKILLFFGFVREYKGLKHLIAAMPRIVKGLENVKLLIVGDFGEDRELYMDMIIDKGVEENIIIVEGYIPDKEVEKYFVSCDLVVLPYESATQSGIVQIAYGFEKPVVVTNVGGLPDVVTDGITGYVVENKNPDSIARGVIKYFKENKQQEFSANVKNEEYKYSWDRMIEVIEKLCNTD
ncbi:MAG: glycosyltransferase family 4 protein [Eubacteriales bacterium]